MCDHRFTKTYLDCVQRYGHRPDVLAARHQTLQHLAARMIQRRAVPWHEMWSLGGDLM